MYIPKLNQATDKDEIVAFMKRFSFATVITVKDNLPVATHLPFLVTMKEEQLILSSHFAKANEQWQQVEQNKNLVIFSEPHAYISPGNYDKEQNVPTWNYISVHAYGQGRLINDTDGAFKLLETMIENFEPAYKNRWDRFPEDYKQKMVKGIVAFEITVTDLQAKKKLSQNRTDTEKQRIIETLSASDLENDRLIAEYMKKERRSE